MTAERWITVADVAEELHYSEKAAWEWLRRQGIRMLNGHSRTLARFRREDYEVARDAELKPLPPRRASGAAPPAPEPKPKPKEGPWKSRLRGRT